MNAPELLPMGLVQGMAAERYHAIEAMSATGLKSMKRSPAHYYGLHRDPARPKQEPTPAMVNGTLVHCCIFEPSEIESRYAVRPPDLDGRTTAGKVWMNDARRYGRDIITAEQLAAAQLQAAALRKLPEIAQLLSLGYGEASAFWLDDETGELCKCRPDWTSPAGDGVILLDGKTCQDASAEGFGKQIWNFRYDLQAAWYSDGLERATGKRVHGFVFGAVESSWPHSACAYMLGDDVLDRARKENRRLLNLYAECKRTNNWPGYGAGIQQINLPAWASKQLENAE